MEMELILTDLREGADADRVQAIDVFLEPRRETLEATVQLLYPEVGAEALEKLRRIRTPYVSGKGKLRKIRETLEAFNDSLSATKDTSLDLSIGKDLRASFGPLLDQANSLFPSMVKNRPSCDAVWTKRVRARQSTRLGYSTARTVSIYA